VQLSARKTGIDTKIRESARKPEKIKNPAAATARGTARRSQRGAPPGGGAR